MSLSYPYTLDDYKRIFDIIFEKHDQYNSRWLELKKDQTFNLKKVQVRHITSDDPRNMDDFIDKSFLEYMESYQNGLYELYIDIAVALSSEYDIPVIGRVKNDDSIVSKLHRKRLDANGSFPVNKYLNDLLGFRVIDKNFNSNFTTLNDHLKSIDIKGQKRIRYSERQIKDYKALHVYFMGLSNNCFPIELQIWDADHERSNLDSHKVYKKEYTHWPSKYRDG